MSEITDIKEILTELNYQIRDCGAYFKSNSLYRNGDSANSLTIYKNFGDNAGQIVIDHVTGEKFGIKRLISLSLGLKDDKEVEIWIKQKNYILPENNGESAPKLKKQPKIIDQGFADSLVPDYSYWNKRGITDNVLKEFRCGLCKEAGPQKDRFVFLVYNSKNEIVGFSGRDVTGEKQNKWKHSVGGNKGWVFPGYLNSKLIKEKGEVILTESIGDLLSCFEVGIKNVICLFGLEISYAVINFLLAAKVKKIVIAVNNDSLRKEKNALAGNHASTKIAARLGKYFDKKNIKIALPQDGKDFNDILIKENGKQKILDWYKSLNK